MNIPYVWLPTAEVIEFGKSWQYKNKSTDYTFPITYLYDGPKGPLCANAGYTGLKDDNILRRNYKYQQNQRHAA